MIMCFNLIVTNAGNYEIDPLSIESFSNINYQDFDNIYFVINKYAKFLGESVYKNDYEVLKAILRHKYDREIIIATVHNTKDQIETINSVINEHNIQGSIFIKDSDNTFKAKIYPTNCVCVYPIEKLDILSPKNKSYVSINSDCIVSNIVEKKVIDHYINVGGVGFKDVKDFLKYYDVINNIMKNTIFSYQDKMYMSNILQVMLFNDEIIIPNFVDEFDDFTTK